MHVYIYIHTYIQSYTHYYNSTYRSIILICIYIYIHTLYQYIDYINMYIYIYYICFFIYSYAYKFILMYWTMWVYNIDRFYIDHFASNAKKMDSTPWIGEKKKNKIWRWCIPLDRYDFLLLQTAIFEWYHLVMTNIAMENPL